MKADAPTSRKPKGELPVIWTDGEGIVHIRNSERGTMNKCPQRWWWGWREGLVPKETAKALWFGTGWHMVMAEWYQPGKKRSKYALDLWEEYADEEANWIRAQVGALDEQVWLDAKRLGIEMFQNYRELYGKDKHWDVIQTEQDFAVRIPFNQPHPVYGKFFILNGTFDGVYYDLIDKCFKLMEHKTAGTISLGHLPMDNQGGTYWAVAQTVGHDLGWLPKGQNIREITYNFARKAIKDDRETGPDGMVHNKPQKRHYADALGIETYVTPSGTVTCKGTIADLEAMAEERGIVVWGDVSQRQPPPLFLRHPVKKVLKERKTQIQRIKDEVDRMIAYVDGTLPLTKSPGRDTCPFCPFKEMCELHEHQSNWIDFRDVVYLVSDPYEQHKKDAGYAS